MMSSTSEASLVVVVPTYNEADNIESLVTELLALPCTPQVIIVDDNSPDGTGQIADRLVAAHPNRVLVKHRQQKGGPKSMVSSPPSNLAPATSPRWMPITAIARRICRR